MSVSDHHNADDEAALWITRLQSRSVSTHDLADFARWRRNPANAAAYARAEAFWDSSGRLGSDPDIAAVLDGVQRTRRRLLWHRFAVPGIALASAAVAVLLFFSGGLVTIPTGRYTTIAGERSVLRLDDGTRVQLDTDSGISTAFTPRDREVSLTKGRAYFEVRHDARRPFVVTVDHDATVTALGTKFDVFRRENAIDVVLYEGSVEVVNLASGERRRLAPGQSVTIDKDMPLRAVRISPDERGLWRSGHLSFNETPLKDALGQINRYTTRPLRLSRESLGGDPISGEFSADDIDGFAAATNTLYGAGAVVRSKTDE